MWPLRRSERGAGSRSDLYLDPAELARKLVKEMESEKVTRGSRISVANRFTVYLCREDYRRLVTLGERLTDRLELDLTRHARSRGYEVPGAIIVELEADPDLEPGYFGIYGERELPLDVVPAGRPAPAARPAAAAPAVSRPEGRAPAAGVTAKPESVRPLAARPATTTPAAGPAASFPAAAPRAAATGASARDAAPSGKAAAGQAPTKAAPASAAPAPAIPSRPAAGGPGASRPASPTQGGPGQNAGATAVISPGEAEELGLARQTIVLKVNNEEHVFNKGRVIVGRSRDVDFRIENADVSRRHAAFYWSDGNIVVKDLGSTNGTMVNGYPIDSTIVQPGDVVLVGDCFITVESR